MKKEKKTRKNEFLDELLKDFHDPERWEKAAETFPKEEQATVCTQNRDFLIQRYRSKFPQTNDIPLDDQKVIRL